MPKIFELQNQLAYIDYFKDKDNPTKEDLDYYIKDVLIQDRKTFKQAIGIIHNKDTLEDGTLKPAHTHIFIQLKHSLTFDEISKMLNVPLTMIQKINGQFKDALAYATHRNAPTKYQYSVNDLSLYGMTVDGYIETINSITNDKNIIQGIYQYGDLKISKRQLFIDYLKDTETYHKYKKYFKSAKERRSEVILKERNLKVIFICGSKGTGKSTLAKHFANKLNYDYFETATGKDILYGYDKEECIICNDFRGSHFNAEDLLNFFDNHNNSQVDSRFNSKDIGNCKVIVITTIFNPIDFCKRFINTIEDYGQFYRRIGFQFVVVPDNVNDLIEVKGINQIKDDSDKVVDYEIYDKCYTKLSPKMLFDLYHIVPDSDIIETQKIIDDVCSL